MGRFFEEEAPQVREVFGPYIGEVGLQELFQMARDGGPPKEERDRMHEGMKLLIELGVSI